MQSFLHNLINDHAMDCENVWIVEDNARSLRYSDPSRVMAVGTTRHSAGSQNTTANLSKDNDIDGDSHHVVEENDQEDNGNKRLHFETRGKRRSDSAVPSNVEKASQWNPLRRSVDQQYSPQRTTIEPLRRNWTEIPDSSRPDSSLSCPVRRVSHEFNSLEATLNALEFDSGEFTSGEFTSGEFSSEMDTIMEDPFGSSCQ